MRLRRRPQVPEGPHDPADEGGTDAIRLLDDRISRIGTELAAAAGGASLCSISKVAGSVPSAKYLEGSLAALLQVRRRGRTLEEVRATVEELSDQWRAELDRVTERDFGPDWLAYRAGGVDELERLVTSLPALQPLPPGGSQQPNSPGPST